MIALFIACAELPPPPQASAEPVLISLSAPRLLRRISLDLRGTLPDVADLDTVEADPGALDAVVARYLDDPLHEERLVQLLADRWHTRVDGFDVEYFDYGLEAEQEYLFERAVGEEPLRLAARIAVSDRPWTEITTTDTTMADALLGELFPIDYPAGGGGWQEVRYTDGRPAAGVLSTNGLWWRYATSSFNLGRSRAEAISRLLTCEDFLARPISFSTADSGAADSESAVREVPACQACHASLDPIAAATFGFWWVEEHSPIEIERYHPEREPLGPILLGVEPAWFGTPVSGLADLGRVISRDDRLTHCAVRTFAEALWRREAVLDDFPALADLHETFSEGDFRVGPLLTAIVATDVYRAGALGDGADDDTVARERTTRILGPAQIAGSLEALTGYRWVEDEAPSLDTDDGGHRVLAGGVDGVSVTWPQQEPGLTWLLVARRAAWGAAQLSDPPDAQPGDAAFTAAVEALVWQTTAERPDAGWSNALGQLAQKLEEDGDADLAWRGVVAAVLQDPRFLSY